MKNIVLLLLTVVSLSGCQQIMDYGLDGAYEARYTNIPIYYGYFSGITEERLIPLWMRTHITYRKSETLYTPEQAVAIGYGDCEEFALMYLNIMYVLFGKKGELCLVQSSGRAVEAGGQSCNHAVVRYESTIIEPMTGKVTNYTICYSYKFDDIFN